MIWPVLPALTVSGLSIVKVRCTLFLVICNYSLLPPGEGGATAEG
jgi:hypothetical protein